VALLQEAQLLRPVALDRLAALAERVAAGKVYLKVQKRPEQCPAPGMAGRQAGSDLLDQLLVIGDSFFDFKRIQA
jgi:hypothetical protein